MKDHIAVLRFFQRTLERLDQMVRELADKSNRIGQKNLLAARQCQCSCGRVQGREQFVLRQDTGLGQFI